ncbi:hypothetical protein HanXRQr2_Chr13g0586491 [Helianthus annuus]|uniref:Uncharacterized protein n=1 Tax=Helianthus annuus TaxID=4232 RepID=A0A9K3EHX7_HELAN|nr:hypothetical protein HanXRQr2_Chr13g0586491 [Helianthus annuus]KAJ0849059.1 hypothetical protein HanPSC8_Chr13g0564611 [Helianthus annuus]
MFVRNNTLEKWGGLFNNTISLRVKYLVGPCGLRKLQTWFRWLQFLHSGDPYH